LLPAAQEKFMAHTNESFRAFGPLLLALAAVTGIALGACNNDDDGDQSGTAIHVRNACEEYCSHAKECDDDRDEQKCYDRCTERMNNCQADEQDAALDKLDSCAKESCDDFLGCRVNVGAKCIFGID
jgi:hypothetical protein